MAQAAIHRTSQAWKRTSGALWPLLQMRVMGLVSPGLVSPGLVSPGLVSPRERGAEWGAGHVGSAQ
jgi:hypothetical protein